MVSLVCVEMVSSLEVAKEAEVHQVVLVVLVVLELVVLEVVVDVVVIVDRPANRVHQVSKAHLVER